jgi:hypothetical protein
LLSFVYFRAPSYKNSSSSKINKLAGGRFEIEGVAKFEVGAGGQLVRDYDTILSQQMIDRSVVSDQLKTAVQGEHSSLHVPSSFVAHSFDYSRDEGFYGEFLQ